MDKSLSGLSKQLFSYMCDLLSPPACAYCKEYLSNRAVYCAACAAQLKPVVSMQLPITATKSAKVFAAAAYQEPIKSLIVAKSWGDRVASKQLADLIWERTDLRFHSFDYLVPVPLHWSRLAKRGFNQAEEIARVVAQHSGKPMINIVTRTKKTIFQSGLNAEQRHINVAASFVLKNQDMTRYYGKHLVIVDDLLTTGATIRAVAHALLELKPASIAVVVASRVTQ